MDRTKLISEIFQICIIPLLGLLTTFFIQWVNIKKEEVKTNINNAESKKYMDMLAETITACVLATNQTYVDSLKASGNFNIAAQEKAFRITCDSVLTILSEDAKDYLSSMVGDLEVYIKQKIEAEVNNAKK